MRSGDFQENYKSWHRRFGNFSPQSYVGSITQQMPDSRMNKDKGYRNKNSDPFKPHVNMEFLINLYLKRFFNKSTFL